MERENSRTLLALMNELKTYIDEFNAPSLDRVWGEIRMQALSRCEEIQGALEHIDYDKQKEFVAVGLTGAELGVKWDVFDKIKGNKRKLCDFFRSILKSLASIGIPGAEASGELFDMACLLMKDNQTDAK